MTMKTSEIETRVKKIVIEQLGVKEDEVKNDASFVDDLGADSLDTVELVMALEEEFDVEIKEERRLDTFILFAAEAARQAMLDSGLSITDELAPRAGCAVGAGIGGL